MGDSDEVRQLRGVKGAGPDHERIQELLAAQALGSLGDDSPIAEDLIERHLPACESCRASLDAFRFVAGELALAAEPKQPPRTLAARLRKDIGRGVSRRVPLPARWRLPGVAASLALVLAGLVAYGAHLTGRVSRAEERQSRTTEVLATVSHPESRVVTLGGGGQETPSVQLAATFVPGRPALYLFGSMPAPQSNRVYQVWLVQAGRFDSAGTFVPEGGQVLLTLHVDPTSYERLVITEEPRAGSPAPSHHSVVAATL